MEKAHEEQALEADRTNEGDERNGAYAVSESGCAVAVAAFLRKREIGGEGRLHRRGK